MPFGQKILDLGVTHLWEFAVPFAHGEEELRIGPQTLARSEGIR